MEARSEVSGTRLRKSLSSPSAGRRDTHDPVPHRRALPPSSPSIEWASGRPIKLQSILFLFLSLSLFSVSFLFLSLYIFLFLFFFGGFVQIVSREAKSNEQNIPFSSMSFRALLHLFFFFSLFSFRRCSCRSRAEIESVNIDGLNQ